MTNPQTSLIARLRTLRTEIFTLLDQRQRRAFWVVIALSTIVTGLDLTITASLFPYISVLQQRMGAPDSAPAQDSDVVLIATLLYILLITLRLLASIISLRRLNRFWQDVQETLTVRLAQGYLRLRLNAFQSRNSGELIKHAMITAQDTAWAYNQLVMLISSFVIVVGCLVIMLVINVIASLAILIAFALVGIFLQLLTRRRQVAAGHERAQASRDLQILLGESFDSFKDIHIYSAEPFFVRKIQHHAHGLGRANEQLNFLPTLPYSIFEYLSLLLLIGVVAFSQAAEAELQALLPYVLSYAMAARRILPAIALLLAVKSTIEGFFANIQMLIAELAFIEQGAASPRRQAEAPGAVRMAHISHSYGRDLQVLRGIDLVLPADGSWTVIVGPSGSGKSTLLDVLSGLVHPEGGTLYSGDTPDVAPFGMAYVAQHPVLLDGTIRMNIAYGGPEEDDAAMLAALETAQMSREISQLPLGLDTIVGEHGTSFSGGQRQRIAIARALFRRPALLVLDEATSALDEETEQRLLQAIRRDLPQTSVVFVTHRLRNLEFADQAYQLVGGKLLPLQQEEAPRAQA